MFDMLQCSCVWLKVSYSLCCLWAFVQKYSYISCVSVRYVGGGCGVALSSEWVPPTPPGTEPEEFLHTSPCINTHRSMRCTVTHLSHPWKLERAAALVRTQWRTHAAGETLFSLSLVKYQPPHSLPHTYTHMPHLPLSEPNWSGVSRIADLLATWH